MFHRSPTHLQSCRRSMCMGLFLVVFVGSSRLAAETGELLPAILKAWQMRAAAVASLEVECELVETCRVAKSKRKYEAFGDEYGDLSRPDSREVQLKRKLLYLYTDGKSYTSVSGQWWSADDGQIVQRQSVEAFDGERDAHLVDGAGAGAPPFAMGGFTKREEQKVKFTTNTAPIAMWRDMMGYIDFNGFDTESIAILESTVLDYQGKAALELAARSKKGKSLRRMLFSAHDAYLPIQVLLIRKDGETVSATDVHYERNEQGPPRLSSWIRTTYREGGEIRSQVAAKVVRMAINRRIDDDRFRISFPVGTHIVEDGPGPNAKCWIQLPNNKLKRISSKEFGRVPANKKARGDRKSL